MSETNFFLSTDITIGLNELEKIHNCIVDFGSSKPIFIIDNNLNKNDYLLHVIENLKSKNLNVITYINKINGEPTYANLEEARKGQRGV